MTNVERVPFFVAELRAGSQNRSLSSNCELQFGEQGAHRTMVVPELGMSWSRYTAPESLVEEEATQSKIGAFSCDEETSAQEFLASCVSVCAYIHGIARLL